MRIDPELSPDGAWAQTPEWGHGALEWVSAATEDPGHVAVGVYRALPEDQAEALAIFLFLREERVQAEVGASWYEESDTCSGCPRGEATDMSGTVTLDADRLPTPGEVRVLAYDLQGLRYGRSVRFQGKVSLRLPLPKSRP